MDSKNFEIIVEIIVAAVRVERELDNAQPDIGMPPSWGSLINRFENRLPGRWIPKFIKSNVLSQLLKE